MLDLCAHREIALQSVAIKSQLENSLERLNGHTARTRLTKVFDWQYASNAIWFAVRDSLFAIWDSLAAYDDMEFPSRATR